MTIIDQLFVTLGLDASGMTKGAKEASAAQDKIIKDAEDAAYAFDKQQRAASESFAAQTAAAVKSGKTTQDDARKASVAFKERQRDEAYTFKKSQKIKIDAAKAERVNANKAAKEKEEQTKHAAEGLGKLRNEVLALGAAYFGTKALVDLTATNAEVGRLSNTLGVSTEVLGAWQGAANKFGASADDVANAFRTVNKIQQDIDLTGNSAALNPLTRAGVDPKFFSDATDAEQKLRLLRDAFSKLTGPRAAQLGSQAGFSENFIRMLQAPKGALDKEIELQKQLNLITKKQTEASAELDGEIGHLKEGLKGVGNEVLTDLNPALLSFVKNLEQITALAKESPKVTEGVLGAGAAIGGVFAVVKVTKWLGAIRDAVKGLGALQVAAEATAAGGVGLDAVGTGAIAAAGGIGLVATALLGVLAALSAIGGYKLAELLDKKFNLTGRYDKDGNKIEAVNSESAARGVAAAHVSTPWFVRTSKAELRAEADREMAQARKDAEPNVHATVSNNAKTLAQATQDKYGVPAAVTLAQYKLESNNGKRTPAGSNNPFGIKAKPGDPFVESMTTEVIDGVEIKVAQKFRKFDTLADAFDAHAKLLATAPAYANARAHSDDPNAYADALTGKYATDPNYGAKLKQIMRGGVALDPALLNGSAAAVTSNSTNNSATSNTSTSDIKIGQVNVHTKATDAPGIAKDIGANLQTYAFASNANVGLQ